MAVFKVVGYGNSYKYKDDMAINNVLAYCSNPKKTQGYIRGLSVNPINADLAMNIVTKCYYKESGLRLRHMILSFTQDEINNPNIALHIACKAAEFYAGRFQIIVYLHLNKPEIHAHIVMNVVSYVDGHKYDGSYKDYYNFISYLKKVLSEHNIKLRVDSYSDIDSQND